MTPDSFSDGGLYNTPARALRHAHSMVEAGANILDIGGESTRPGSEPVEAQEEKRRLLPVLRAVRKAFGEEVVISVDTRKASVMQLALEEGAKMINDTSGFCADEKSLEVMRAYKDCYAVVMHCQGLPKTMQACPVYENVVEEVRQWLSNRCARLMKCGILKEKIFVDPGIGFGKKTAHNGLLLQSLSSFQGLGAGVVLGVSRKSFIGKVCTGAASPSSRLIGSIVCGAWGVLQGVQILRVHDIKETKQMLQLLSFLRHDV